MSKAPRRFNTDVTCHCKHVMLKNIPCFRIWAPKIGLNGTCSIKGQITHVHTLSIIYPNANLKSTLWSNYTKKQYRCLIKDETNTFAQFKNKYFLNLLDWTFFLKTPKHGPLLFTMNKKVIHKYDSLLSLTDSPWSFFCVRIDAFRMTIHYIDLNVVNQFLTIHKK